MSNRGIWWCTGCSVFHVVLIRSSWFLGFIGFQCWRYGMIILQGRDRSDTEPHRSVSIMNHGQDGISSRSMVLRGPFSLD